VPEARELEGGHVAHGEPANPLTGEAEDTDVGFPGPEHHIAERAFPMKAAMGPLALLAIIGGALGIPGLTDTLETFLEPTFEDSRFHDTVPTEGSELLGLGIGAIIATLGISAAFFVFVRRRGLSLELRDRFPAVHNFLIHKWYFDELYDAVFVRPLSTAGSFGRRVIETEFVQGFIVGGATGVVRAGTSFARAVQTGYLRAYALLLLLGAAGLLLYFLIAST
jgi:NADH-quinone oxidoreductase subunit L